MPAGFDTASNVAGVGASVNAANQAVAPQATALAPPPRLVPPYTGRPVARAGGGPQTYTGRPVGRAAPGPPPYTGRPVGITRRRPAPRALPAPPATTQGSGDNAPAAPKWAPKYKNVADDADPFVCPGLANDCFHYTRSESGYFDHVARRHNYTRRQLDKPDNAAALAIFKPARRLSWFNERGVDTTYQGDEPKQKAARKRMREGIKTDHPDYANLVYKSMMTTADVPPAAPAPAAPAANPGAEEEVEAAGQEETEEERERKRDQDPEPDVGPAA